MSNSMYLKTVAVVLTLSAISLAAASILALSGCIAPAYWDGWVSREVVITVLDESSTNSISDATVTHQNLRLPNELKSKSIVSAKTGPDGIAKLFVYFPGSGKRHFLGNQGYFSILGDIVITADGYSTLTEPLSSLIGEEPRSTEDKSAIYIRVSLTRDD